MIEFVTRSEKYLHMYIIVKWVIFLVCGNVLVKVQLLRLIVTTNNFFTENKPRIYYILGSFCF